MTINSINFQTHTQLYSPLPNPISKKRLDILPKELIIKILDFILPKSAYLNHLHQAKIGIFYTSKIVNNHITHSALFKIRPEAVNEIIRHVKGDIEKLPAVIKSQLKQVSSSIQSINLSNIKLTARILRQLAEEFPNLASLDLHNCELDDDSLIQVGRFTKLKQLSLGENTEITSIGIQALLPRLTALIGLNLTSCIMNDSLLKELLISHPRLTRLILANCNSLTNECVASIAGLTKLKELDLSCCSWVEDDGFKCFISLKKLKILRLTYSDISDEAVKILPKFPQLRELDLSHCMQLTPISFEVITTLHRLTQLLLGGCTAIMSEITSEKLQQFTCLQELRELILPSLIEYRDQDLLTRFPNLVALRTSFVHSDADIKQLAKISGIKNLDLSSYGLSNLPGYLTQFKTIEVLNISRCAPGNIYLNDLTQLPYLRELNLSKSIWITPIDLTILSCCSNLSNLNLSYCKNLEEEGHIQLHTFATLTNLIKLHLNGWKMSARTDYSDYSQLNFLNTMLNNFDNAIHDPHLLYAMRQLRKQLPSLEIDSNKQFQPKEPWQKIEAILFIIGNLLLDLGRSVIESSFVFLFEPIFMIRDLQRTADQNIRNNLIYQAFFTFHESLNVVALGFLALRGLSLFPLLLINIIGTTFIASDIYNKIFFNTTFNETMLNILISITTMFAIHVCAFIPISISLSMALGFGIIGTTRLTLQLPTIATAIHANTFEIARKVIAIVSTFF